jgi:tetratricopeptide (TPR) repeat protein
VILVLLAVAAGGVCDLPEPAPTPDAASARAYLEVGDAELAADSAATALVAYREAVRLDPANPRARSAYLSACVGHHRDALLADGWRLMDAGDCRGAIDAFRQLPGDPAAALYEAICRYQEGDDDEARPLLRTALAAPAYEDRARYFLGLIELRDRSGNEAAELFGQVAAAGGPLAERAEVLRTAALRSGRAVVGVSVEPGYDSNVNFTPDNLPGSDDFGVGGALWLALRPLGLSGPYLRANAYYLKMRHATDNDLGFATAQAGYRLGRGETYAFGDYGYEATTLGGSPLLYAHRLRAGGRWQIRRFALSLVYALRIGTYQTADTGAFSGNAHFLTPEVSYRLPLGSSVALGYSVSRDQTSFADTSAWEQGPRAAVRWAFRPTLRGGIEGGLFFRSYDAGIQQAPAARFDAIRSLSAYLEQDIDRVTVGLAAGVRNSVSNEAAHTYTRVTATLGASYTLSLF